MISNDLNTILSSCWQMLSKGALQKKNPLHIATIGTVDNQVAQLRTVVLRKTDIANRQLFFYTDIRSAKVRQIMDYPSLSWLFYHPKANIQIRTIGIVKIHHLDKLTSIQWKTLPTYGRKTYGTQQAPSTFLDHSSDDLPVIWQSENLTLLDTEYAYKNFAVIACEITQLEWLHLQRSGHQRAKFEYVDNAWKGQWLVP